MQSAEGNIAAKFGVNQSVASGIAASLIPMVMQKFTQQTGDPNNNSFDMNGIIQSIAGGSGAQQQAGGVDFNQILNQFQQGGNAGGGVDVASIAQQFLGGNQQQGGIGGLISGFLK